MADFQPALTGGILAGGASRRFGSDKSRAILAGRSLRDHVADNLRRAGCDLILESNNDESSLENIPDLRVDAGPLAGVEALLTEVQKRGRHWLLTCPVDIPVLPANFGALMTAAAAKNPDKILMSKPQNIDAWLCSAWPVSCLEAMIDWLNAGERRVRPFLEKTGTISVPFETDTNRSADFLNINRPDDLEMVAKLLTGARVTP